MVDGSAPKGTTWKHFLASHAKEILAVDFTTHPLWNYAARCVFVVLALDTRRVVYCAVTASPTLAWVKRQLREATAWGDTPRFLLHDNDGIWRSQVTWAFGSGQYRCRSDKTGQERTYRCALDKWLDEVSGVTGIPTPYGAPLPWAQVGSPDRYASAHVERFIGPLRRECLVHFAFVSEVHLRRAVTEYVTWHNTGRVHQGIDEIPDVVAGRIPSRRPPPVAAGQLVGHPVLGGLAHDYELAA